MNEVPPNVIVLRVIPFRDHDAILHLLTRGHGKIPAFHRNRTKVEKRSGAILEPLDRAEVTFQRRGSGMPSIGAITPARTFRRIRDNIDKFSLSCLIVECFDAVLPEEQLADERPGETEPEHPEYSRLFPLLEGGLQELNDAEDIKTMLRGSFVCLEGLLQELGILAERTQPSLHAFLKILSTAEGYAERELASRALVTPTFERFQSMARAG